MDLEILTVAMQSIRAVRDILKAVNGLQLDIATLGRINDALEKVSAAQDQLADLRDHVFELQTERDKLQRQVEQGAQWIARTVEYQLYRTPIGGTVYRSHGPPEHFACPSCWEKKHLQILQGADRRTGKSDCPGCDRQFAVGG